MLNSGAYPRVCRAAQALAGSSLLVSITCALWAAVHAAGLILAPLGAVSSAVMGKPPSQ